jgi:hypothetical protein
VTVVQDMNEGIEALDPLSRSQYQMNTLQADNHLNNISQTIQFEIQKYETNLISILNLFQQMLINSSSTVIITHCLSFLKYNHGTVTHYLQGRELTTKGYEITRLLVALLLSCMVPIPATSASVNLFIQQDNSGTPTKKPKHEEIKDLREDPQQQQQYLFDHVLGIYADSFTSSICDLLRVIGNYSNNHCCLPIGSYESVIMTKHC